MARFLIRSYYDKTLFQDRNDGQNSKIIKNIIPSVLAAETQSKGSFHPTTTISTRFHHQNASSR